MKVKIYGAGSIGNHLAQASRRMEWSVVVVDSSPEALRRMREEIYPKRYGTWDAAIELYELGKEPKGEFDIICLGTPPHVRIELAREILKESPKIIQLEKPLCTPLLEGMREFQKELTKHQQTAVLVGYDHVVSKAVRKGEEVLKSGVLGEPLALDVEFRETWKGIFSAHPWLSGPKDTYLGFWRKGGGASGEHSHATNLWQYLSHVMGLGKVKEVQAAMTMVANNEVDYDESCYLTLTTESGFIGRAVQDLITEPVKKVARVQCSNGFLEIAINGWEGGDLIRYGLPSSPQELRFEKKRPDDFYEEMLHIKDILEKRIQPKDSPMSLERGIDTMTVIQAAHESRVQKKTVAIL